MTDLNLASVKQMPRNSEGEETFIIEAYPQGSPEAPVVARLTTRSFCVAMDIARAWKREGFVVVRRRVVMHVT